MENISINTRRVIIVVGVIISVAAGYLQYTRADILGHDIVASMIVFFIAAMIYVLCVFASLLFLGEMD